MAPMPVGICLTCSKSDQSGVQRHDLKTGETDTIWQSLEPETHVSFDPSFWTPWGTFVTAEEDFKGTDYQRPEDMQIQTIQGRQYLYVTTTTTNEVYRLDLRNQTISVFANQSTIDLATGMAVGAALANVDNLAVDADGNIYIVEDFPGGEGDDIWLSRNLNHDGDLTDPGEGLVRWASNGTAGSEFTGLYFDPFDKRRAWVDIQHPDSGNDRTIEIRIPKH
jgi:secreted PhoX family phosphatase